MPTNQFENLCEDKKNAVINAALEEFGSNGVLNASTNSIVKKCGISKGSLFKYFETKDDLCFYLFDIVTGELLTDLTMNSASFSTDIFQRIIDYSTWEIGWYISNPVKGKFVVAVARETDSSFAQKRDMRYGRKQENVYYNLLEGVSVDCLKTDKKIATNLIKWILEGFNKEFLEREDVNYRPFEELKKEYIAGVTKCMESLKIGIIK